MMLKKSKEREHSYFVPDLSDSVWNLLVVRAKVISCGLKQTDILVKLLEASELTGD